jgi:hypothetical protein
VKFDSSNPFFKSKYASLAAIIGETRPILGKHGLAMEQVAEIVSGNVTVRTNLRHSSGQVLHFGEMTMSIGDTGKSEAQAAGSLITYLRRYSWQTALGIAADEDDDGNTAPTKQQAQKPEQATDKTRMWALNLLQAAPGQPNREVVTSFLARLGWLTNANEPETWQLRTVPVSKQDVNALSAQIQQWDVDRHQPLP